MAILRRQFRKVLSIRAQDYLLGHSGSLKENIERFLFANFAYTPDEVYLQTMPRMFGYAFNPVSFWFCRRAGQLEAILTEVNNTFGERHFYWLKPPTGSAHDVWLNAKKSFHVSPFLPVEGSYRFRFRDGAEKVRADIQYFGEDGQLRLTTWVEGILTPAEDLSLWAVLWRYGWMTPLVVWRIHFQAFRLWTRKIRYYPKPPPLRQEIH